LKFIGYAAIFSGGRKNFLKNSGVINSYPSAIYGKRLIYGKLQIFYHAQIG